MKAHNKKFGAVIRSRRLAKRLSQEELAFAAGMDRTHLSVLELGQKSPTLDTITLLCETLGISLVDLAVEMSTLNDPD